MSTLSKNQIVVEYVVQDDDVKKVVGGMNTLTAKEKEALTELRKYNDQLKKTGSEGGKAVDQVSGKFGNMNSTIGNMGKTIAGVFAVSQIIAFGKEVLTTTAQFQQFQKVIDFTSGSAKQGAISFQFLVDTSNRLGISLESAIVGYKTLSGAASQAGISNQKTRQIFEDVSKAVAAFGLSGEDAKGVYLALGQIISKGTVSAEELRGQIGERIPGAFAIAARSIGKTEAELNKMLQTGQVASKDFIIPFTRELAKASEAADGKDGLTQRINRVSNAFQILQTRIGRGLLEPAGQVGNLLERALNYANKLLETEKDRTDSARYRAYNQAIKDGEKLSEEALKNAINNKNAQIRGLKEEFQIQQEKIAADGKEEAYEKTLANYQALQIERQEAYRDGLYELLKGRKETNQEAEKTNEELENEYKAKVQLLELDKKIAALRIQLRTEEGFERNVALLRNDVEYGEKRLAIDREYAAQSVQDAVDNARIQGLINQTKSDEVIATIKTEAEARKKEVQAAKDGIRELQNEQINFENKKRSDAEESVKNQEKLNKELVELEKEKQEKFKEIEEKSQKDEEEYRKDIAAITVQEWEAYSMVASTTLDNVMNLYKTNIDRQMNALNQKYAAEIRLADGNVQKINELNEKRAAEEKELREKEFRAQQLAAVAQVIFKTAPIIAQYLATGILAPLAAAALIVQGAQIAYIMAQPVPEFREGTKGKAYQGKAIVGEEGSELVVTQSGKVYKTPSTASLVNLSEKSHVIPAPLTEKILSGKYEVNSSADYLPGQIVARLESIEGTLRGLPFTNVQIDREGFFVYQEQRAAKTKRLNSKFKSPMLR